MNRIEILISTLIAAVVAWLILCIYYLPAADKAQNQDYIGTLMASAVHIDMGDGECSGWVLKDSHQVVTAAHCAPGVAGGKIFVDFGDGVGHEFYIDKIGDTDMFYGPDMMLLSTKDKSVNWPAGFEPCTDAPKYGEKIIVIGSPYGLRNTVTFGRVSQPSQDMTDQLSAGQDKPAIFARNYIQFDGEAGPGNSGGPAISESRNCVIGIADILYYRKGEPFAVKLLEPISYLYALH